MVNVYLGDSESEPQSSDVGGGPRSGREAGGAAAARLAPGCHARRQHTHAARVHQQGT